MAYKTPMQMLQEERCEKSQKEWCMNSNKAKCCENERNIYCPVYGFMLPIFNNEWFKHTFYEVDEKEET